MAKEQKRGTKEIRKPKAEKAAAPKVNTSLLSKIAPAPGTGPKKKG